MASDTKLRSRCTTLIYTCYQTLRFYREGLGCQSTTLAGTCMMYIRGLPLVFPLLDTPTSPNSDVHLQAQTVMFCCRYCCFCPRSWLLFMRHTFQAHSNEPNFIFTCGVNGCQQTFKNYSSITSHLKRRHGFREFRNFP